jgi:hypothetical protein
MSICWYCEVKYNVFQSGKGTQGDSLGSCRICHTFACGWHGLRDNVVPEYLCVECLINKLGASAVALSDSSDTVLADFAAYYQPPVVVREGDYRPAPSETWRFNSPEEFLARCPVFDKSILTMATKIRINYEGDWNNIELRDSLSRLPDESKKLIQLAVAIILALEIQPEYAPVQFRDILNSRSFD